MNRRTLTRALAEGDWNRLDRMRSEDRAHLDDVTEKLSEDSIRQWKAIQALDKDLGIHKTESAGVHQQPCPTAAALMASHTKDSLTHNPKIALPFLATVVGLASTLGAWLAKILHVKSEIKP